MPRHVVHHGHRGHQLQRAGGYVQALRTAAGVGRMVGQAINTARKGARASKAEERGTAPAGTVTTQHDISRVFKKRKISKAKIRKIRFAKKVEAATRHDQPFSAMSQTCLTPIFLVKSTIVNSSEQWATTAAGDQVALTMNYGQLTSSTGDLPRMMDFWRDPATMTGGTGATGAPAIADAQNFKIHLGHQRFHLNVTNVSTFPLTYDIYQFVAAQDISDANYASPATAWTYLLTNVSETRATFKPFPESNGQTPLDVPEFGRYWRLLKKDRVLLGGAGTTDVVMTGLHPRVVERSRLQGTYAVKGLTQAFLVVAGIGDTTNLPDGSGGLVYNITRITWNKIWHFTTDGDGANGIDRPFHYHKIGP